MKNILFVLFLIIVSSCSSVSNKNGHQLKGYFSYMADAAIFVDCETNEKYPVVMEGDYISLEREYLKNVNAGEQVLVKLNGEYIDRNKVEGDGTQKFLIIEKYLNILPNQNCD